MKVVFISNFFNHHQEPLSLALYKVLNGDYCFIATECIPKERKDMGYEDMNNRYPFILTTYDNVENEKKARQLVMESEVVLFGSAPKEYYLPRIRERKLTFAYMERLFKQGLTWKNYIRKWIGMKRFYGRFQQDPLYILCASAYTAGDINRFVDYSGKTFKWGYFPVVKQYDFEQLCEMKRKKDKVSILWVGRQIKWKHPEKAIIVAEYLKIRQIEFEMNIIGGGELEQSLYDLIDEKGLENNVHMMGAMSPNEVRQYMEAADIFLFTSDFNEGWGAVLNEAMNCGCAVVASHAIGSVPFLIRNNVNGIIYRDEIQQELNEAVYRLVCSREDRERLGQYAYETLIKSWNAEVAAERFIALVNNIKRAGELELFSEGPCSQARSIQNDWIEEECDE